jgi:nicotinic acid mononucleotide adenylyltransferase
MGDRQNIPWDTRFAAASAKLTDSASLCETSQRIHAIAGNPEVTAEPFGDSRRVPSGGRRVGLFAGTFNPLTLAHIALVESAMESADINRMLWVLAVASIDKEKVARATLVDRLVQLEAYVTTVARHGVLVVNRGLYVEQVNLAHAQLSRDDELVVLVGYDKIVQILDPRYYSDRTRALDELFQRSRFLVAPRGTATSAELEGLLAKPENRPYSVIYLWPPGTGMIRLQSHGRGQLSLESRRMSWASSLLQRGPRWLWRPVPMPSHPTLHRTGISGVPHGSPLLEQHRPGCR